jgi:tetratricopeptide (TPR) repeat protein
MTGSAPTRDQLDSILRARSGSLADAPYPILLLALAYREKTAVLRLHRNQLEKTIIIDSGAPVDCRSNIATETLGRFLASQGKLSEQDYHSTLSQATSRGLPLGEILTERKLLAPSELYRALQQNLGRKLLEPFSWKSGTFDISYDVPAIDSALRVKVPQLLVTGIVKVEAQESADEAVAAADGRYLALAEEPLFPLEDLRLTTEQRQIVDAARRGTSMADIRAASGLDDDDLNRIVYALMLLGLVEITAERRPAMPRFELAANPFEAAEPAPASRPAPAASAPPARRPVDPALAEEVMGAYLGYRRKDAFELLGVEETDGASAFIRAYMAMVDRFLPAKFDGDEPVREKAQEVFLAAARAYGELADPDRRDALIKRRGTLREQEAAAVQAGIAALIDPEELCRTGRTLASAGKLREALSSFEMAMDCDAQNGTYAAEAAWIRYQLRSTPALTALKLLKNAIRIDPNSGEAYLYAGRVQAILGNRLEAQAYVGRAASLLTKDDPRLAEALRAIK